MIHERAREHRKHAQEADLRFSDASKRLSELKNSGIRSQTAEQILSKLQQDVKDLNDRKDSVERISMERESHLEKLQSWDNADRVTTEDDVHMKRDQVNSLEDEVSSLQERMDAQLERNTRLVVFRQASAMALKKFREREDEVDKLQEELRRLQRQTEEKDAEQKAQGKNSAGKMGKRDLKKYGAIVREKIEKYKKMKEDLSALRAEVVVLQRTEEILKSRHKNLDDFLDKLAAENGVAVSGLSHVFVLLPQDITVANVDFYVGASPAYHGTPRIYV
jgi:intraflagellar transport protein 81